MIVSMKELLIKAHKNHYAVPALNTQGGMYDITWAILRAAEEMNSPVILAHYDCCSEYAGLDYFIETSKWCANKVSVPVVIHLDHGDSVGLCKRAMECGCSSVMYDGSALPIDENAANTIEIMEYAKERGISVEAEIGRLLRTDMATKDSVAENCADIGEVKGFLSQVTPDALAVAIGNAHGFYQEKPVLNYQLLDEIRKISDVPLVLHGGTGLAKEAVWQGIQQGIAKVNIGTEIRCNYVKYIHEGIEEMGLKEHAWKISKKAIARMTEDVKENIRMCGSAGKA